MSATTKGLLIELLPVHLQNSQLRWTTIMNCFNLELHELYLEKEKIKLKDTKAEEDEINLWCEFQEVNWSPIFIFFLLQWNKGLYYKEILDPNLKYNILTI